jgi:polar amino acid transport system ATP-binding protein
MSDPVLRLVSIKKRFGAHRVLRGIDFGIHEHEVVIMIGASGSASNGK